MPFPTFTEKTGAMSAVGMAKETTFGTAVTATQFIPALGCTLDPDPGLFSPAVMMQSRDKNIFPLYGQYKFVGNISAPLFPTNGIYLFVGSIGNDNAQGGTAAGTAKNGTITTASAGATSLTYTVTNATPAPTTNDYFMIGPSAVGTFPSYNTFGGANTTFSGAAAGTMFVTKPTNVTGAGPYTLTVPSIPYAINSAGSPPNNIAQAVVAPFFHRIDQANLLPSYTIEKDIGGGLGQTGVTGVPQSIQYAGTRVGKLSLKLGATNSEAQVTYDLQAQQAILPPIVPTATTYINETPFVFAEATLNITSMGGSILQCTNVQVDVDNGLKPYYTFSSSHNLSYLTPATRVVTAKVDVIFDNFNDASFGYFNQIINTQPQGNLTFAMLHPAAPGGVGSGSVAANESIAINIPAVNLAKYVDALKMEDATVTTLDITGFFNLSNSYTIQAIVGNNLNTGY
jgi:hypothetical protein